MRWSVYWVNIPSPRRRLTQTDQIKLMISLWILKRQAGKDQSECEWEAPFLTMRKEHTGTFNKKIKTSLIYFWPSFNHRVKNTTLMFLFTHKIQASKVKRAAFNESCMSLTAACWNYTVLMGTVCSAALVSWGRQAPLVDWNSLSFPSRVPVSS